MRMNCMNCDHHLICRNADDDKNHVCSMYDPIFNRTNADLIRAMSDEELSYVLCVESCTGKETMFRDEFINWLKQEVE